MATGSQDSEESAEENGDHQMTTPSQLERLAKMRRDDLLTLAGEHREGEPADRRAASVQLSRAATSLRVRLMGFLVNAGPHRGRVPVRQRQAAKPELVGAGQDRPS
jgi:hypothetical protein